MPGVPNRLADRCARSALVGAAVVGLLWGIGLLLRGVRVPGQWITVPLPCDHNKAGDCVGAFILGLLLGVALYVAVLVLVAGLFGWWLLRMLRVPAAGRVALLGPAITVAGLFLAAAVRLVPAAGWLSGGITAVLGYAIAALPRSRSD